MRRYAQHRKLLVSTAAVALALTVAGCGDGVQAPLDIPPAPFFGNGAPNGTHYNLNVIGTSDKSAAMDDNSGHRIFVKLDGNTRILLAEGDEFLVLDANGTDGSASFQLPPPDPGNTGTTVYSVYVRALGKPGGGATNTTCGLVDTDGDPTTAPEELCSVVQLILDRGHGKQKFVNVSKELLYVYWDADNDGTVDGRSPLFGDDLQGAYWDYDNDGLRLAQFRFYPCSTTVPDATNPNDPVQGCS